MTDQFVSRCDWTFLSQVIFLPAECLQFASGSFQCSVDRTVLALLGLHSSHEFHREKERKNISNVFNVDHK